MTQFHLPKLQPIQYQTSFALIYHRPDDGMNRHPGVFTYHELYPSDQGSQLGAGNVLTDQDTAAMAQLFGASSYLYNSLAFLPETVLALSHEAMIWWAKPRIAPMYFNVAGRRKFIVKNVPWPALVFKAQENGLTVFAMRNKTRPTPKTRLYHAPIMNVYQNGSMCLGSCTVPAREPLDSIQEWEKIVYKTYFSHVNHEHTLSGKIKIDNEKHIKLWESLSDKKTFPSEKLSACKNMNLSALLNT